MNETLEMLDRMSLVEALWWFIENESGNTSKESTALFFALRERYREEGWR